MGEQLKLIKASPDEMLSHEEAVLFLSDVLNVSTSEDNDPLTLLNRIIRAFQSHVPFQSVTLKTKLLPHRTRPTLKEIKEDVMAKRGGLCYTLNVFMKHLLEKLGYVVHHAISKVKSNNDHILTIAMIRGSRYLVDVANGYPTFEAIPLDFEKESKIYQHSFLEYKFSKDENSDKILRWHLEPSTDTKVSSWRIFCVIDPTPRDLSFFDDCMSRIYTTPELLIFHTSLRIISFPQGRALILRDGLIYVEDSETHKLVIKNKLSNHLEIIETVRLTS